MGLLLGLASPNTPVPNSNQEITIGSGFLVERNFNAGVDGTSANTTDNPAAAGIGFDGTAEDSFFTNDETYEGALAVECNITVGTTAFGRFGGRWTFPEQIKEGDTIWLRTRNFYPSGWDFTSGLTQGLKHMRIHTKRSNGDHIGYYTTLLMGGTTGGLVVVGVEGPELGPAFKEDVYDPPYPAPDPRKNLGSPCPRDEWVTYETQIKFHSVRGQGVWRVWQDGILIFENLITQTFEGSGDISDFIYIYTYWNEGAPRTQKCYLDDVVFRTSTPSNVDAHGNPYIGMT